MKYKEINKLLNFLCYNGSNEREVFFGCLNFLFSHPISENEYAINKENIFYLQDLLDRINEKFY